MKRAALLLVLTTAAPVLTNEPDRITLYCGGGVTGGGGGIAVGGDGRLIRLSRGTAGRPLQQEAVPDRTAPAARWHALLDAAGFERLPRGSPSNMTCSLARRRNGQSHTVLWSGLGLPATLPPAVRQVVTEMREAARP